MSRKRHTFEQRETQTIPQLNPILWPNSSVRPDAQKVAAIHHMPPPADRQGALRI